MSAAASIPGQPVTLTFDLTRIQDMKYAFDALRIEIYSVMFILCLAGYFMRVWQTRSEPNTHFMVIPHIALLIVFGAAFPHMRPLFQTLFYTPAEKLSEVSSLFQLNEAMNYFDRQVAAAPESNDSILGYLGDFTWNFFEMSRRAIVSWFFTGLYIVLATIAGLIATPFYFLQLTLVETCFAFSPIAFGCMAVPALREKGVGFLTMLASIMAWPMGFAIVAAMTNIALSAFPAASGVGGLALGPLIGTIVGAAVMLVGTLMVPPTAFYLFMHGGTVFNPLSNAAGAIPFVGRVINFKGR